jgi:DNA-binding response OmpR family regulator
MNKLFLVLIFPDSCTWTMIRNFPYFEVKSITENSSTLGNYGNKNVDKNNDKFIMVLDDDFDIVNLIKTGLQKKNYSVFAFTDPHLALEHFKINSSKYDIVISDLRMPSMNGIEFLENVKGIKTDIKIFLMTAFEIADLKSSIESLKIDEFFVKPFSIGELNATINNYYRIKKSELDKETVDSLE